MYCSIILMRDLDRWKQERKKTGRSRERKRQRVGGKEDGNLRDRSCEWVEKEERKIDE